MKSTHILHNTTILFPAYAWLRKWANPSFTDRYDPLSCLSCEEHSYEYSEPHDSKACNQPPRILNVRLREKKNLGRENNLEAENSRDRYRDDAVSVL